MKIGESLVNAINQLGKSGKLFEGDIESSFFDNGSLLFRDKFGMKFLIIGVDSLNQEFLVRESPVAYSMPWDSDMTFYLHLGENIHRKNYREFADQAGSIQPVSKFWGWYLKIFKGLKEYKNNFS